MNIDANLELIARKAAEKLMRDRPSIGADMDTDQLTNAFIEVIQKAFGHNRRHLGPG